MVLRRSYFFLAILIGGLAIAQPPPTPNATLVSPEIQADRSVVFRLYAPQATDVAVRGDFLTTPGAPAPKLQKQDNGVWTATLGPFNPGPYRYNFLVNGVASTDPRNRNAVEGQNAASSFFYIPGADFMDWQDVPHGAVQRIWYMSKTLNRPRRMHVYTPPGYNVSTGRYPILYLLHGGGGSDDEWSTVGRAGFILDNLIANGKALPMIIVMPDGHVDSKGLGDPNLMGADAFNDDFLNDIMPFAESSFRVKADRANRAIAGLSMGGVQTLNIALPNLAKFGYVGIFSSGWFDQAREQFEQKNADALNDKTLKKGLKLLFVRVGKDDIANANTYKMLELFSKHGFHPDFLETPGGHTWINWRENLNQFAPQLFR